MLNSDHQRLASSNLSLEEVGQGQCSLPQWVNLHSFLAIGFTHSRAPDSNRPYPVVHQWNSTGFSRHTPALHQHVWGQNQAQIVQVLPFLRVTDCDVDTCPVGEHHVTCYWHLVSCGLRCIWIGEGEVNSSIFSRTTRPLPLLITLGNLRGTVLYLIFEWMMAKAGWLLLSQLSNYLWSIWT